MITINQNTINKNTRKRLNEGRDYQMGFAFAKKLDDENYQLVQPLSPCKDYLNDVIFAEHTGKSIEVYGSISEKNDIFEDKAYLCFAIMPNKYDSLYNKTILPQDIENLNKRYVFIEAMIHNIEMLLGLKEKTTIFKVEENLYLAEVPLYWIQSSWTISLYSLLIRAFQYTEEYVDPMEYLKAYPYNMEQMLVKNALPKLEDIIKNGIRKQDFSTYGDTNKSMSQIHNHGILAYEIKT